MHTHLPEVSWRVCGGGGSEVAAVCLLVVASLSISIRVASPACAALWFHLLFDDDDLLDRCVIERRVWLRGCAAEFSLVRYRRCAALCKKVGPVLCR